MTPLEKGIIRSILNDLIEMVYDLKRGQEGLSQEKIDKLNEAEEVHQKLLENLS